MLIRRVIALLLIGYVALGGAVINQLHNHDHHGPCDAGLAEHHPPCPVSVFFANVAAEADPPNLDDLDLPLIGLSYAETCCIVEAEPGAEHLGRAPPLNA